MAKKAHALSKYQSMRDFERTREPKGKSKLKSTRGFARFVVQKHDATRLHYDFRLELDGTLKSWAIPKGPPMDPDEKHLALHVEDHPVEYQSFEGKIPDGEYGAGPVIIWDRGRYHYAGTKTREQSDLEMRRHLAKGRLSIVLEGDRLKGELALVRLSRGTKGNEWLAIKKRDDFVVPGFQYENTSVVSGLSLSEIEKGQRGRRRIWTRQGEKTEKVEPEIETHEVRPMLTTLTEKVPEGDDWIYEIKWDGYRAIAEVTKKGVAMYSRNHNSFNASFPTLVKELAKLKRRAILDGEVVVLDKQGKSSFQGMQRLMEEGSELPYFYVFDLLFLDGKDLRKKPLLERKKLLKPLIRGMKFVKFSEHVTGDGKGFQEAAKAQGLEGIVAKRGSAPYQEGRRTYNWLKIKNHQEQEAVIGGFTTPRGGRKHFGALVLGTYEDGKLKYIGHTGTGFDDKTLASLRKRMEPLITDESPFDPKPKTNMPVTWVKPVLVAQVRFHEWTSDQRMRAPVFLGLREDKPVKAVHQEVPVEKKRKKQPKLLGESAKDVTVNVDGHDVKLTHLNKIYWPNEGYTKKDLIDYYRDIGDVMLPYLVDRPESLLRHPNGIEEEGFFQKNITTDVPRWVKTKKIRSKSRGSEIQYLLCQNKATLIYLANLGCIEINPWTSRVGSLDRPDFVVIDLDPEDIAFSAVVQTAVETRSVLEELDIESYPKTSGKTGLHIYIPLGAKYDFDQAVRFAEVIANIVNQRLPDITSVVRSPKLRQKRVYVDFLQNRRAQTIAAAYSLRPYPNATVSTPLRWSEVRKGLDPSRFNIHTMRKRIDKEGDLWEGTLKGSVNISRILNALADKLAA